jgi:hypothetical protein
MANTDAAFGFRPVRVEGSSEIPVNTYYVPASDGTALFIGDPVILTGTADSNGVASVTRATAGSSAYTTGVVIAVKAVTDESTIYREASTERYVVVADNPYQVFEVQQDSIGAVPAITDVGNTVDFIAGTGDTVYGKSAFELDTSNVGTGDQFVIEGFVQGTDNEVGNFAKVFGRFNLHQKRNTTGV